MPWKWNDAVGGAIDGGISYGPYGAIGGFALGGFSKGLDKDLTGNSRSGTVEGLIGSRDGAMGSKIMGNFSGDSRDKGLGSSQSGLSNSSFGGLMNIFQNNQDKDGNLNSGSLGTFQGQDLSHSGNGTFQLGGTSGLDITSLLKLTDISKILQGFGGGGAGGADAAAGAGSMGNLFADSGAGAGVGGAAEGLMG
jgi:hypothetical protein